MFETRVADLLTAILGNYIKPSCFSSDKISVAVWSGYVVLRQVGRSSGLSAPVGDVFVVGIEK